MKGKLLFKVGLLFFKLTYLWQMFSETTIYFLRKLLVVEFKKGPIINKYLFTFDACLGMLLSTPDCGYWSNSQF